MSVNVKVFPPPMHTECSTPTETEHLSPVRLNAPCPKCTHVTVAHIPPQSGHPGGCTMCDLVLYVMREIAQLKNELDSKDS